MGQLRTTGPKLKAQAPALAVRRMVTEGDRTAHAPWRAWYKTAQWQRLRWQVLVAALFTCAMCRRIEGQTRLLVADHVVPHRGDARLFWEQRNLQCLCKACHDGAKQAGEKSGKVRASSHPAWFGPVHVPLTIVCGPPGAGKSSYVAANAGAGDLVICFDAIAREIYGSGRLDLDPDDARLAAILRRRNEMLGWLMRPHAGTRWTGGWLIVAEPDAEWRAWWDKQLKPREIVVIETPAEVCRLRVAQDAMAGDVRSDRAVGTIEGWWRRYVPRPTERRVHWGGDEKPTGP